MKFTILDGGQEKKEVEFTDISTEMWREYDFGNDNIITINEPKWLYVSASGGHRIVDGAGLSHYIPKGWIHLFWQPKQGAPAFVR